jgi:hypothetical protein
MTTVYNLRMRHTIVHLVRRFLRRFGYLKVDYGFACGRYWVEIDGKVISQTSATHVWLRDDDVHRLGYAIIDHGKHWDRPSPTSRALNSVPCMCWLASRLPARKGTNGNTMRML